MRLKGRHSLADLVKHAYQFDARIYGMKPGAPANPNIKKMISEKAFGLGDWKLV